MDAPSLSFVQIHSLAHRFNLASDDDIKDDAARGALLFMENAQILHPCYEQCYGWLRSRDPESAEAYSEDWASKIAESGLQGLFMGDEYIGQAEKSDFFPKFVPQFQQLFVSCDFSNLQNLLNKVTLSVHFVNQCTELGSFTENRYFEFLFYQIIAVVYGSLWFPHMSKNDDNPTQADEASPTLKWAQIERKCENYGKKSRRFLENLDEEHPDVVSKVNTEFFYCSLVKWYCAFAKLRENRVTEFCADFEALQTEIEVLEKVHLQEEALICYGIASVATKPFKDLDFRSNEQVLDFYTSNTSVEACLYEVLRDLSMAKFASVKQRWNPELLSRLDCQIAYTLPRKSKGTFWEYLSSVIDVKTFLLIMSFSECITRERLLEKMGYRDAPESVKNSVSNMLVVSISVLSLGDRNVFYDQTEDAFYNLPVEKTSELSMNDKLDELDHAAHAEAAAAHMKTLLIRKYFS